MVVVNPGGLTDQWLRYTQSRQYCLRCIFCSCYNDILFCSWSICALLNDTDRAADYSNKAIQQTDVKRGATESPNVCRKPFDQVTAKCKRVFSCTYHRKHNTAIPRVRFMISLDMNIAFCLLILAFTYMLELAICFEITLI